jgi:hypothetical protein
LEDPTKNKSTIIKLAKELYKSKGTPASYQFLFRLLYNADVEFFYTRDAVMKASSGKWYIAKSLRLNTSNFINAEDHSHYDKELFRFCKDLLIEINLKFNRLVYELRLVDSMT